MADFGPEKVFWGPSGAVYLLPDLSAVARTPCIPADFGPGSATIQPWDPAGYSLPPLFCLL